MQQKQKKLIAKATLKNILDLVQLGKVQLTFANDYSAQDWKAFLERVDKDIFSSFDHNGAPKKRGR